MIFPQQVIRDQFASDAIRRGAMRRYEGGRCNPRANAGLGARLRRPGPAGHREGCGPAPPLGPATPLSHLGARPAECAEPPVTRRRRRPGDLPHSLPRQRRRLAAALPPPSRQIIPPRRAVTSAGGAAAALPPLPQRPDGSALSLAAPCKHGRQPRAGTPAGPCSSP